MPARAARPGPPEPAQSPVDGLIMEHALALARNAVGLASPNPTVGCVLASHGPTHPILGQGAHLFDHRDHAEIAALKQAAALGHDVRGATAYVTLEPCAHHGRTGPCALALIAAGITRAVVATTDPNPLVSGRGLQLLREAGVAVTLGPGHLAARALNLSFAHFIQHRRPFVTLKSALSADGFLAPPPHTRSSTAPVWLTSPVARAEVHQLRHASDALLTGIGTVLSDDPALTDRSGLLRRRPLLRVVLDPTLRTPATAQLLRTTQPDLLLLYADASPGNSPGFELHQAALLTRRQALQTACPVAEILPMPADPIGRPSLVSILNLLAERQCLSLLLEAGPTLNAAFLAEGLVDRVVFHQASHTLGPGSVPFAAGGPAPIKLEEQVSQLTTRQLGPDLEVSGLLHDPWPYQP